MNDNDALLAELHPLEVPDVSSVPAIGWWVVLLIVIAMLVVTWFMVRNYRQRRWLRDATQELEAISSQCEETDPHVFLSALSQLLRRVLIKWDSRAAVASLQGDEWLNRLDELHGEGVFRSELGLLLSEWPYQRTAALTMEDRQALITASATLIKRAGKSDA